MLSSSDLEITEDVKTYFVYKRQLFIDRELTRICNQNGLIELEINWRGFKMSESYWLGLYLLEEDVPDMFKAVLIKI